MRRLVFIAHSCQNLSNPFIYKASGIYIKSDTKRRLVLAPIIEKKVNRLMDVITHNITAEVMILAKRYERTLAQLQGDYQNKEMAVFNHLKAMGFEL